MKRTYVLIDHELPHIGFHTLFDDQHLSPKSVRTLSMHSNSFCFLTMKFGVVMYFINASFFVNNTKKPLEWNNLMLYLFLLDNLPILFS